MAVVKIMLDLSHGDEAYKAIEAWDEDEFQLEQSALSAQRAADKARCAAMLTVSASEQVCQKLQTVRMQKPPGLTLASSFVEPETGLPGSIFGSSAAIPSQDPGITRELFCEKARLTCIKGGVRQQGNHGMARLLVANGLVRFEYIEENKQPLGVHILAAEAELCARPGGGCRKFMWSTTIGAQVAKFFLEFEEVDMAKKFEEEFHNAKHYEKEQHATETAAAPEPTLAETAGLVSKERQEGPKCERCGCKLFFLGCTTEQGCSNICGQCGGSLRLAFGCSRAKCMKHEACPDLSHELAEHTPVKMSAERSEICKRSVEIETPEKMCCEREDESSDSDHENDMDKTKGEINAVSRSVDAQIGQYAAKYSLDNRIAQKIRDTDDTIASEVIKVELSSRVRNPSAYVSRVLRDKMRAYEGTGHNESGYSHGLATDEAPEWYERQSGQYAEGDEHPHHEEHSQDHEWHQGHPGQYEEGDEHHRPHENYPQDHEYDSPRRQDPDGQEDAVRDQGVEDDDWPEVWPP